MMGRRGNPRDDAGAESFIEAPKAEAVSPMACETSEDVAAERRIGLASSTASATAGGCTPPSVT
jgi:hypothetical protein